MPHDASTSVIHWEEYPDLLLTSHGSVTASHQGISLRFLIKCLCGFQEPGLVSYSSFPQQSGIHSRSFISGAALSGRKRISASFSVRSDSSQRMRIYSANTLSGSCTRVFSSLTLIEIRLYEPFLFPNASCRLSRPTD
jgi:hypothetical protein